MSATNRFMTLHDLKPYVRFANIIRLSDIERDIVFRDIKSCDCRLFYFISGGGKLETEGISHDTEPGALCILQPGTRYMWRPDADSASEAIIINFDYTQDYSTRVRSYHPVVADDFEESQGHLRVVFGDADCLNSPLWLCGMQECESVLRMLVRERLLRQIHGEQLVSHLLSQVILTAVRAFESHRMFDGTLDIRVRAVLEYIGQHYTEELTNERIAAHFCFHPTYLGRLIKQHTGHSLHKFVILCRINAARELILGSDMKINEIAHTVGFSDVPNFTRSFKRCTGVNPSDYTPKEAANGAQLGIRISPTAVVCGDGGCGEKSK